jgi:hypothetical protein
VSDHGVWANHEIKRAKAVSQHLQIRCADINSTNVDGGVSRASPLEGKERNSWDAQPLELCPGNRTALVPIPDVPHQAYCKASVVRE